MQPERGNWSGFITLPAMRMRSGAAADPLIARADEIVEEDADSFVVGTEDGVLINSRRRPFLCTVAGASMPICQTVRTAIRWRSELAAAGAGQRRRAGCAGLPAG